MLVHWCAGWCWCCPLGAHLRLLLGTETPPGFESLLYSHPSALFPLSRAITSPAWPFPCLRMVGLGG